MDCKGQMKGSGRCEAEGFAMTTAQQTKDKTRPRGAKKDEAALVETAQARGAETTVTAGHGVTFPVLLLTPRLKLYGLRLSLGPTGIGKAGRSAAGRLPSPERLAFYGALGAAAVFGVIDWPVAVAVGVGLAITRRARTAG